LFLTFFRFTFSRPEQSAVVVTGQSCTSHAGCTEQPNQYCDSGSNCYTCYFCINIYNDAIDGETSPVTVRAFIGFKSSQKNPAGARK